MISKFFITVSIVTVIFFATVETVKPASAYSLGEALLIGAVSAQERGLLLPIVEENQSLAAQKFIEKLGEDAISFLSNDELSTDAKAKEFRRIMNASFDMRTIGIFVLGKNWRTATSEQQAEYQKLFNDMIVKVYTVRLDNYKGQKFEVASVRDVGKKDLLVSSHILPVDSPKVKVDWRVRQKNGRYKIIDVMIEGVSMSLTQRSDFSSVIQRGGGDIEVLLEHLRK